MPNPTFIPIAFATNGFKNTIQKTRQPTQPAEDMTWADGTPPITTTPLNDGGKAPKGQDFNGVLFVATENGIFVQNGNRYKWNADVVTHYGGYAKDAIVQSDDGIREFRSLIDNNATNPNSNVAGTWMVYAGVGSVPVATSTVAGIMTVINNLTSTNVGSALSAAMGRALSQAIDLKLNISNAFGINQSPVNVTGDRFAGSTYTNNTSKPIFLSIVVRDNTSAAGVFLYVGDVLAVNIADLAGAQAGYIQVTYVVPPNVTYRLETQNFITHWSELR